MNRLENRGGNWFLKLKSLIVEFLRDRCFCFRNFLSRHTKDMCFSKKELEEIKKRVEKTKESEVKFDEFSKVAPDIYNFIEVLKNDVDKLELEKEFCLDGIRELYLADVDGNDELKKSIFSRFGLPFVLEK